MKKFKMISCWILISIIIQSGIFLFLNNYFKTNTKVTVKKIDIKQDESNKDLHIDIPKYISNEKISFDGHYIAFKEENKLKVLDTLTGDSPNLELSDNFVISNFNWLYDRNRILVSGKKNGEAILYTIEMDNISNKKEVNVSSEIAEVSKKSKKKSNDTNNFTIEDFTASPITAVIYLKLSNKENDYYIYRVDASDNFDKLNINARQVKNISIIPREDKLVYENSLSNNFYMTRTKPNPKIDLKKQGNFKMLKVSEYSKLYVGEVINGNLKTIVCKNLKTNSSEENLIDLKQEVPLKDIFITINGHILVNSNSNSTVTDLTNNKEYKYTGRFLNFFEKGFTTLSEENKLNKYTFKK